jgi:hypothetical protein
MVKVWRVVGYTYRIRASFRNEAEQIISKFMRLHIQDTNMAKPINKNSDGSFYYGAFRRRNFVKKFGAWL